MEHSAINLMTYTASVLIALLAGLGSGFFLHFYNTESTKKGLARMLCVELQVNYSMIKTLARRGMPASVKISDDVYRGLLSSGNMRYLARHQLRLYDLYASMRRNDRGVLSRISAQMVMMGTGM